MLSLNAVGEVGDIDDFGDVGDVSDVSDVADVGDFGDVGDVGDVGQISDLSPPPLTRAQHVEAHSDLLQYLPVPVLCSVQSVELMKSALYI